MAKKAFTENRASNSKVQDVGGKANACERDKTDSQFLLKYFLIKIGLVILGFGLSISSVYFLNYSTFLLKRSYLHSVGQQEITLKMKKEPICDLEQSERGECVIKSKHLAEDALVNTKTSTDQNKYQDFDKILGFYATGERIKNGQMNIRKEKKKINDEQKVATKKYTNLKIEATLIWGSKTPTENLKSENIRNAQRKTNKAIMKNDPKNETILVVKTEIKKPHFLSKRETTKKFSEISDDNLCPNSDIMENEINFEKRNNKKLLFCLKSESYKTLLRKGLFVSKVQTKKHHSNIKTETFLKKNNKVKMSQETTSKKKQTKKVNQKNSQNEIKNFKSTIQKMFIPKKIFVDRRQITPIALIPQKHNNNSVKIFMFEEFLSKDECDNLRRVHDMHIYMMSNEDPILCFDSVKTLRLHLKNAGKKHLKVSSSDFTKDTTCVNKTFSYRLKKWLQSNWSYSTAFYPGENYFSTIFEDRVKQATGLHPGNGGKFQITSYPKGIGKTDQATMDIWKAKDLKEKKKKKKKELRPLSNSMEKGYKKHTDCIENNSDRRDRMATVLVYLDTVKTGGETRFPELGISVRPKKGRAIVWNNMDENGKCESMSAHIADIVTNGHKYILQRWYYYQNFYSLGKRPPQAENPKRKHGQARVSCDEYAHGSCRWYDEWNHDHLIQYHQNNITKI